MVMIHLKEINVGLRGVSTSDENIAVSRGLLKHTDKCFPLRTDRVYVQQNPFRMFKKLDEPNMRPPASFVIVLTSCLHN